MIDSFDYSAAPAQAALNWPADPNTPAGAATPVFIGGRQATLFPVNFQTTPEGSRALWDRTLDIDLSWARGVEFDIYIDNLDPIAYLSIYFRAGAGWYRSVVSIPAVGAWTHVTLDLMQAKIELTDAGELPAGWFQIDGIRISAWRSTNVNTSFALSRLQVFGGTQAIDGFHYATDAAARSVWTETNWTRQGPVSIAEPQTENRALILPVSFAGAVNSDPLFTRANWDALLSFSLDGQRGLQFDIKVDSLASISFFTIYLRSGSGWFKHTLDANRLTAGAWQTIQIHRHDMQREDDPDTWNKITILRFSVWRNTAVAGTNTNVTLRELRTLKPEVLMVRQENADDRWAPIVAAQLSSAGVVFGGMSDRDVPDSSLEDAGVVVLPYHEVGGKRPLLPSAIDKLAAAISNSTIKYLGFYNAPVEILTALGMQAGQRLADGYDFAQLHVDTASLPGSPAIVRQASWNIITTQPIANQSSIVATWHDRQGVVLRDTAGQALPALVGSDQGILMTHVLLNDDRDNKQKLLTAMIDKLAPGAWGPAATQAIDRIGFIGPYQSFHSAVSAIQTSAVANGTTNRVSRYFDSSAGSIINLRGRALDALANGDYGIAYDLAMEAQKVMHQAYSAAEVPLAGEVRAFFCHDAVPPAGESWDSTIKKLSEGGINMLAVNVLTGGGAYYPSSVAVPGIHGAPAYGTFPNLSPSVNQLAAIAQAAEKYGVDFYAWKTNWQLLKRTTEQQNFRTWMNSQGRLQFDLSDGMLDALDPTVTANRDLEVATMVELATQVGVKGILFDYIRFASENSSFSEASKSAFESHVGLTLPADWSSLVLPGGEHHAQWVTWRQSLITEVVQRTSQQVRAASPNVKITAAVFPNWILDKDRIGQDWVAWLQAGYLDFAVPMNYQDSNASFQAIIRNQKRWTAGKPFYPAIGLSSTGNNLSVDQVVDQIKLTRQLNTGGFYIFDLTADTLNRVVPILGLGITGPDA